MDGTVVTLSEEDEIIDFVSGKNMNFMDTDKYYKTVNIYKFSKEFSEKQYVPFLYAYSKALGNNEYYEQVLRVITLLDNSAIRAKRLNNQLWYEIDDACDLDIAESLFLDGNKKLDAIKKRYGGYWRYTRLVDFCYLVNPYYPPKRMFDEIKNNFDALVTQYPSGADVISLIASRNFGVDASRIVVGNGAAELINIIMKGTEGKIGFIRPTFEEYPNRCDKENAIVYEPKNDGFRYSADDIIEYFQGKDVKMVVLINPDNPSGNYIQKSDVLRIAKSLKSQETIFLVDESFVDFCDYDDSSLLDDKILEEYNNLLVVKSISKSYGVPGLRIGIVATSHKGYIDLIKKEVSIWNINSFAEYYLQISSKYANDYSVALNKFKESRKYLEKELAGINYITPYSSQANYILCKLENGVSAEELTAKLLNEYNIYIKDLSSKISTGEYVRIAVRDLEDNAYLIDVLKELEKLYD
jgi:histidinol-phosphate/aromatic aminotransferase/cobyric acid decarboxylase-like protein